MRRQFTTLAIICQLQSLVTATAQLLSWSAVISISAKYAWHAGRRVIHWLCWPLTSLTYLLGIEEVCSASNSSTQVTSNGRARFRLWAKSAVLKRPIPESSMLTDMIVRVNIRDWLSQLLSKLLATG